MKHANHGAPLRWAALMGLLVPACVAPTFRMPTLPTVPSAVARPSVPPGQPVIVRDDAGWTETSAAPGVRLGRSAIVAVGPIRSGSEDLGPALLRRLLGRHAVRVLDLTAADQLTARLEQPRGGETLALNGPLLALVWGARLGAATHVLVADSLRVEEVTTATSTALRYESNALETYTREREQAVRACASLRERLDREIAGLRTAFDASEAEYQRARTVFAPARDPDHDQAQSEYTARLAALAARRAECESVETRLPAPDALRAAEQRPTGTSGTERRARATGSFRLVEVPGGQVVWAGALARDGAGPAEARAALLEALADALPGMPRGTAAEPAEAGSTARPSASAAPSGGQERRGRRVRARRGRER